MPGKSRKILRAPKLLYKKAFLFPFTEKEYINLFIYREYKRNTVKRRGSGLIINIHQLRRLKLSNFRLRLYEKKKKT